MKTNTLLALIMAFMLSIPIVARAEATGTRGGGQVTDINGHPQLRDVLENCDWSPATEWVATLPKFPGIIDSVRRLHWYFASAIEREPQNITVCTTTQELKQIPAQDADGLTIILANGKQVAVRMDNMIFLNAPLFDSLDPDTQGLTAVHELMHSFIPMNVSQRNEKLRSIIGTIARNIATPMTLEHFKLQVQMDGVAMPLSSEELEPIKEMLLAVLDLRGDADQRGEFARKILTNYPKLVTLLNDRDQKLLQPLSAALDTNTTAAVNVGDVARVLALIEHGANWKSAYLTAVQGEISVVVAALATLPQADVNGNGSIAQAAKANDLDTLKAIFLNAKANPNDPSIDDRNRGTVPLVYAIGNGNVEMVKFLLAQTAINSAPIWSDYSAPPLARAVFAAKWDVAIVLALNENTKVEKNIAMNTCLYQDAKQDYCLNTFGYAISNGQIALVRAFITRGLINMDTLGAWKQNYRQNEYGNGGSWISKYPSGDSVYSVAKDSKQPDITKMLEDAKPKTGRRGD